VPGTSAASSPTLTPELMLAPCRLCVQHLNCDCKCGSRPCLIHDAWRMQEGDVRELDPPEGLTGPDLEEGTIAVPKECSGMPEIPKSTGIAKSSEPKPKPEVSLCSGHAAGNAAGCLSACGSLRLFLSDVRQTTGHREYFGEWPSRSSTATPEPPRPHQQQAPCSGRRCGLQPRCPNKRPVSCKAGHWRPAACLTTRR
jgi:hypothetical protein